MLNVDNSFILQVNMVNNQIEPSFVHNHSVGYVQKALGISNVSGRDPSFFLLWPY
jgi:hypothetical protein